MHISRSQTSGRLRVSATRRSVMGPFRTSFAAHQHFASTALLAKDNPLLDILHAAEFLDSVEGQDIIAQGDLAPARTKRSYNAKHQSPTCSAPSLHAESMDTIHQEFSKQAVDWVGDTGFCALNPSSKRLRLPQRCVSSGSQHCNMQRGGAARPAHGSEEGSMCNDSWSSQHRGFGRRVRVAGPASLEPNAGPRQGLIRSNSLPMADGMASDPVLASVRGPSASCAADVAWQTCPRPPAAGRQGPGLHGKLSEGCKPPLPGPLTSRAEQLCSGSSRRRLSHPECGGGNRPGVASKDMDAQPGMEQCWPWLEAGSVPLPFTTTKLQSWLQGSPRMSSRDVADMQYSMQAMQLDMQRLSTSNDLLLQSILAKVSQPLGQQHRLPLSNSTQPVVREMAGHTCLPVPAPGSPNQSFSSTVVLDVPPPCFSSELLPSAPNVTPLAHTAHPLNSDGALLLDTSLGLALAAVPAQMGQKHGQASGLSQATTQSPLPLPAGFSSPPLASSGSAAIAVAAAATSSNTPSPAGSSSSRSSGPGCCSAPSCPAPLLAPTHSLLQPTCTLSLHSPTLPVPPPSPRQPLSAMSSLPSLACPPPAIPFDCHRLPCLWQQGSAAAGAATKYPGVQPPSSTAAQAVRLDPQLLATLASFSSAGDAQVIVRLQAGRRAKGQQAVVLRAGHEDLVQPSFRAMHTHGL
ncbi:hypothetical protein V8C86DRAFT_2563403 [Haematococcus lacustris]